MSRFDHPELTARLEPLRMRRKRLDRQRSALEFVFEFVRFFVVAPAALLSAPFFALGQAIEKAHNWLSKRLFGAERKQISDEWDEIYWGSCSVCEQRYFSCTCEQQGE